MHYGMMEHLVWSTEEHGMCWGFGAQERSGTELCRDGDSQSTTSVSIMQLLYVNMYTFVKMLILKESTPWKLLTNAMRFSKSLA